MDKTVTQKLASALLPDDVTLASFVAREREAGHSWRLVARHLYEQTQGQIDVTAETLRAWCAESSATPVAS